MLTMKKFVTLCIRLLKKTAQTISEFPTTDQTDIE